MAGIPSASKRFKAGIQSAKGTTPTLFVCAMMQMSGMLPERDAIDMGVEHGCSGASTNYATAHKTSTEFSSLLINGRFRGAVYPSVLPIWLHMVGHNVAATAKTGYTEHVATLATRAQYGWGAILDSIGDLSTLNKDARLRQFGIEMSKAGLINSGEIVGLSQTDTVGTPTVENEDLFKLLPSKGTFTLATLAGSPLNLVTDLPRSASIQVANPLDTDTEALTSFGRTDLPQQGIDITGQVRGCSLSAAAYKAAYDWTSNKPGTNSLLAELTMLFQSAANINGAAVPYSLKIEVPKVEITLPAFDAEGNNQVFFDYNWRMVADSTTPITWTIANLIEDYTP